MNEGILLYGRHLFYCVLAFTGILSGICGFMVSEGDRASAPRVFCPFVGGIMLV